MDLTFAAATDVGRQRDHNEDNFLVDRNLQLFVVADGMGGHAAGEVASAIAVRQVRESIHQNRDVLDRFMAGDEGVDRQDVLALLEHAVQSACTAIYARAQEDDGKRGMGTTCSLMLVLPSPTGERGFIAHVGDSRIYLVRGAQLHQLTEDHSLVNELVRSGRLRRDEIDGSPYREYKNAVTRAVGVHENVVADTMDFDVLPGDQYLLCSDGLHGMVGDEALAELLVQEANLDELPARLIARANERGGKDNITTVVVRLPQTDQPAQTLRSLDVNLRLEVLRNMPIFRNLSYKELVFVLNLMRTRAYDAGQVILQEGSDGQEMFIVLEGSVALHKAGAFITELGRGEHLGEMALVDTGPRSVTAIASDPSRLLVLSRVEFYELLKTEAALSVKLLWSFTQVLAERLRKTTAELSGARLEAQAEDLSDDATFEDEV